MKQYAKATKDLAQMGGIELLGNIIQELKLRDKEIVHYTGDLGQLAYDTGRQVGNAEALDNLITTLLDLAQLQS